ncbi:hypothetical protein ILYODFUR_001877 [Ilyodon furcidens]|uniref:Uncharacterized protein n=1 Tax=Ilyodon furcidens TaxID=33524 RepID=A0ABV0UCK6_9TELE
MGKDRQRKVVVAVAKRINAQQERPIYMLSLCRGAFRSGAARHGAKDAESAAQKARQAKREWRDGRVEKSELFPKFASRQPIRDWMWL